MKESVFNTFLGLFAIQTIEGAISRAAFVDGAGDTRICPGHENLVQAFTGYFEGRAALPDLPLRPDGTAFQRRVWDAVRAIPHGSAITYAQLAVRVGEGANPRNVGQANAANPIAVAIPCHRVLASGGDLAGYAWGLERKRELLLLEGLALQPDLFKTDNPQPWN